MFSNPFTPIFGGRPDFFFGRKAVLTRFDAAMVDQGSEDRVLFVTGNRGCGKTALLEQISMRAQASGRKVVDLGAEHTVELLMRHLVRDDELTRGINPAASVSLMGAGVSLSGVSSSKTTHLGVQDLGLVFLEACAGQKKGVLVTIDEVQKISLEDMSAICGAFQMASRKGHDVMLVVAGLPYSFDRVIQYEGCTYMRRCSREELGLLSHDEVAEAFDESVGLIDGISMDGEARGLLVDASMGHPYIVQLLGYYLVSDINGRNPPSSHRVVADDVRRAVPMALGTYERRALKPLVEELAPSERDYLRGMTHAMGDGNIASTSEVAKSAGRSQSQLSRARESLIRSGTILAPARGKVMFNVPYLRGYILREPYADPDVSRALEWNV